MHVISELSLIRQFPLRPIRSDGDLDRAIGVLNALIDREALDVWEEDYLDVLGDLVERYEEEAHPMKSVPDQELLRHLIEAKQVTQAQVAAATGIAESTISEVLAGKRGLDRRQVCLLASYFRIIPAAFTFA